MSFILTPGGLALSTRYLINLAFYNKENCSEWLFGNVGLEGGDGEAFQSLFTISLSFGDPVPYN